MLKVFDKVVCRSRHWLQANQTGEIAELCSEHRGRYIVVFNKFKPEDEGTWLCLDEADLEKV